MPAPNDLTWEQLQAGFTELGISNVLSEEMVNGIYNTNFDLTPIVGSVSLRNAGVMKFISKLLDACRIAQERANLDDNGNLRPSGERLDAFPAPVTGTIVAGQVPVNKTVRTRSDLTSVTKITGATA